MTWRACSPPWPGRRNPGSWPPRRQCGLPSAGPPLQSASHPLRGGQRGTGGLGPRPVPGPGWPRCWSRQRPGWAASSRPTRTSCPAPFSSWPTSPWRRRLRIVHYRPPTRRERGTSRPAPSGRPAGRAPARAIRRAPLSAPAGGRPRRRTFRRYPRRRPVTAPPGSVAARPRGTHRVRRRGRRLTPVRHRPGPSRSTARASSAGPRASRPRPRTVPDLRQPRSSGTGHPHVGR